MSELYLLWQTTTHRLPHTLRAWWVQCVRDASCLVNPCAQGGRRPHRYDPSIFLSSSLHILNMARHASSVRSLPHCFAMGEVCSVCYCREWALAGGPLCPDITDADQVPPRPRAAQTTPPLSDGNDCNGSGKCRKKTPRPPKPKTPGPPKPPPLPPGKVHSRSRRRSRRGTNRDDDSDTGSREPTPPLEPPENEPRRLSFAAWNTILNRQQKAAKIASKTANADSQDDTTDPSTVPGFAVSEAGRASSSSIPSRLLTVILLEFKPSPKGFKDIVLTSPR